jgi:hypothetical protein
MKAQERENDKQKTMKIYKYHQKETCKYSKRGKLVQYKWKKRIS